jgi:hypothetical protein
MRRGAFTGPLGFFLGGLAGAYRLASEIPVFVHALSELVLEGLSP